MQCLAAIGFETALGENAVEIVRHIIYVPSVIMNFGVLNVPQVLSRSINIGSLRSGFL